MFECILTEQNKYNFLNAAGSLQIRLSFAKSDGSRLIHRIAINTGADGWKGNRPEAALLRHSQRFAIARSKQFRFALSTSAIHRADGMDNVPGGQTACFGNDGLAR